MQGKGIVKFFLIVMTIVCLIQFVFILPTNRVEKDAEKFALEKAEGISDEFEYNEEYKNARNTFLDSMSSEEVFKLPLLKSYTYQELKAQQLKLGLDLKGGMSVVLQIDLKDFLLALSDYSKNKKFLEVLDATSERIKTDQRDYITLFASEWAKVAEGDKLADVFRRSPSLGEVIKHNSSDQDVLYELRKSADETVELTFTRLKQRIDKFGVTQPNVSLDKGRDLILVELPGIDNPERARAFLQASAALEFWDVYRIVDEGILGGFVEADRLLAAEMGSQKKNSSSQPRIQIDTIQVLDSLGNATGEVRYDTLSIADQNSMGDELGPLLSLLSLNQPMGAEQQFMMPLTVMGTARENSKDAIMRLLQRSDVKKMFPSTVKFLWSRKPAMNYQTGEETKLYELYAIKMVPGQVTAPLEGDRVIDATTQPDPITGSVTVSLNMDNKGARIWGEMTTKAAQDDNKPIAIVLDDEVVSAPNVNEPIKGGRSSISGNFSVQEGQDLANILKIGKLPAKTNIVQESIVGPSLGQDNINSSAVAIMIGFTLLLILMLGYYGGAGVISIIALLANIFFILGTLSSVGTVLTLPGIAGIVLTMGMAVDANVIIYERIREELENGKTVPIAIQEGFKWSYAAIIDGNVTTFIIGVVLAYFGMGPIKGFAVVLIIGIICTLLTAVLLTRLMIDWWIKKGRSMTFWTRFSKGILSNVNIDWMGKKKFAYVVSGTLLGVSLLSFGVRGFEFGIDFKGGRSYDVQFEQGLNIDADAIRSELAAQFESEPIVKSVDVQNKYNITTAYLISESNTEADSLVISKLYTGINKVLGGNLDMKRFTDPEGSGTHVTSSSKVGPTIAKDILDSSWKAGILALLLVFVYILIRFSRWQYSLGGVLGLAHDAIVMMGMFSLLHGIAPWSMEVDQTFIAALLTIIGYSINDTVIIFDRIREYLGKNIEGSKDSIINMAINNTLRRTIITSFSTLLTVTMLFFFGGESIRGFAFAIMVGVLVGTYSSIFVATTILSLTSKDLTRKVKRKTSRSYTAA